MVGKQTHIVNTIWMNFMFHVHVCKLQISSTSLVSTRRQTSNGLIRTALDSSAARNDTVWCLHATDTDGTLTALAEIRVHFCGQPKADTLSCHCVCLTTPWNSTLPAEVQCHTSGKEVVHGGHERVLNWPSWNVREGYVNITAVQIVTVKLIDGCTTLKWLKGKHKKIQIKY
jgi:hypothetical protein